MMKDEESDGEGQVAACTMRGNRGIDRWDFRVYAYKECEFDWLKWAQ